MKVIVDAMCADFGGIRTYVEHLLAAWERTYPDDELVVMVPTGSSLPVGHHRRVEVDVARPTAFGRPWAQTHQLRRLVRHEHPDALLATLPSTTLRKPKVPTWVVVYDLRHELEPEQFSWVQRLLRRVSYGNGYRVADGFISISQRTLDDLHGAHPRTRRTPAVVAHLGADHVLDWPDASSSGHAIAFGHHSNKNLDLIIAGWHELVSTGHEPPRLLITGVGSGARPALLAELASMGLSDHVDVAEFLPDEEFIQRMSSAGMVMFPSSFEGFGLPVVEGMLLGIPVVIGPERATLEVAGGHAVVLEDWTPAAITVAALKALQMSPSDRRSAAAHAATFTWARNVEITRRSMARATAGGVPEGRARR